MGRGIQFGNKGSRNALDPCPDRQHAHAGQLLSKKHIEDSKTRNSAFCTAHLMSIARMKTILQRLVLGSHMRLKLTAVEPIACACACPDLQIALMLRYSTATDLSTMVMGSFGFGAVTAGLLPHKRQLTISATFDTKLKAIATFAGISNGHPKYWPKEVCDRPTSLPGCTTYAGCTTCARLSDMRQAVLQMNGTKCHSSACRKDYCCCCRPKANKPAIC